MQNSVRSKMMYTRHGTPNFLKREDHICKVRLQYVVWIDTDACIHKFVMSWRSPLRYHQFDPCALFSSGSQSITFSAASLLSAMDSSQNGLFSPISSVSSGSIAASQRDRSSERAQIGSNHIEPLFFAKSLSGLSINIADSIECLDEKITRTFSRDMPFDRSQLDIWSSVRKTNAGVHAHTIIQNVISNASQF